MMANFIVALMTCLSITLGVYGIMQPNTDECSSLLGLKLRVYQLREFETAECNNFEWVGSGCNRHLNYAVYKCAPLEACRAKVGQTTKTPCGNGSIN